MKFVYGYLNQATFWRGKEKVIRVDQMTKEHAKNALPWMERHEKWFSFYYFLGAARSLATSGLNEDNQDAISRDMETESESPDWITDTPLYKAVKERAES